MAQHRIILILSCYRKINMFRILQLLHLLCCYILACAEFWTKENPPANKCLAGFYSRTNWYAVFRIYAELKKRGLCDCARDGHETLLQFGLADAAPAAGFGVGQALTFGIHAICLSGECLALQMRVELCQGGCESRAMRLDFVHQVDFFLAQFTIATDFAMLVFHGLLS